MGNLVGQSFWLALPVTVTGILHMVVVSKNLWAQWKVPLDGGAVFRGRRLFGDNKTWRGAIFMVVGAAVFGALQGAVGGAWAQRNGLACVDFARLGQWVGTGAASYVAGYSLVHTVIGLGYVLGELPNSFAKRRLEIGPGETQGGRRGAIFFLLDQADSVVASLALAGVLFSIGWGVFLVGSLCLTLLHLAINAGLYGVKVRKNL